MDSVLMLKNLVISADSVIGLEIVRALGAVGTTRRKVIEDRIPFDLRSRDLLPVAERVYFCSGINGFKKCADDPKTARLVNVCGAVHAAADQVSRGGKVVLLSSCAVETHPNSVYGTLKRETEDEFLKFGERASIFRFGPVQFDGRVTYQNHDYHPISIEKLVATVTAPFDPGLHKIYNAPGLA